MESKLFGCSGWDYVPSSICLIISFNIICNCIILLFLGKANNGFCFFFCELAHASTWLHPAKGSCNGAFCWTSAVPGFLSVRFHPQFSRPLCLMMTNLVACLPICDVYRIRPVPLHPIVGIIMFIFRYCSRPHLGHVSLAGRLERAARANRRLHVPVSQPSLPRPALPSLRYKTDNWNRKARHRIEMASFKWPFRRLCPFDCLYTCVCMYMYVYMYADSIHNQSQQKIIST